MFMFYRCCGCPALVLNDKDEWCCADYYVQNDYIDVEYRALSDMEEEDCPIPYIGDDWELMSIAGA